MIRSVAASFLLMALAACASLPADPAKMSAEQLTAYAKDRNATAACAVINSPYGRGVTTYVVLDKGTIINGSLTMDNECKVTISNMATVTLPAVPVVSAVSAVPASAPVQ